MVFPSSVYFVPYMSAIYAAMHEREAEAARVRRLLEARAPQQPKVEPPASAAPQQRAGRLGHAH